MVAEEPDSLASGSLCPHANDAERTASVLAATPPTRMVRPSHVVSTSLPSGYREPGMRVRVERWIVELIVEVIES